MSVAIFLLHRVSPRVDDPWDLSLEPAEYERFIEVLVDSGTLTNLPQAISDHAENPHKLRCVLTFDDGYDDLRQYAFPVLKRMCAPAMLFLPTRYVADSKPFWWDVLLWLRRQPNALQRVATDWGWEMESTVSATIDNWVGRVKSLPPEIRDCMMEGIPIPPDLPRAISVADLAAIPDSVDIQCHGHSHSVLSALSDFQVQEEVCLSCDHLAAWTGKRPNVFAYPNGQPSDFSPVHARVLQTAGISYALTTVSGMIKDRPDPYSLPRILLKPGQAMQQLEGVLSV
jgi:peptidoglycan/xylan/chitin deacetylase (PgdA/CDA1 family)